MVVKAETAYDVKHLEAIVNKLSAGVNMVVNNEYDALIKLYSSEPECYIHIGVLTGIYTGFSISNLDPEAIELTRSTVCKGLELTTKHMKSSSLIYSYDPNDYTEDECIAQLLYSQFNAALAFLSVIGDQSVMGFIKGAYRIRIAYNNFKQCEKLLNGKTNWKSALVQKEFESGALLALGGFQLGISFLPKAFIKLLEFAGFDSDRTTGLNQIVQSAMVEESCLHKLGSSLVLIIYYSFTEYFHGLGEVRFDQLMKAVNMILTIQKPGSPYYPATCGLMAQIEGDFEKSVTQYDEICEGEHANDGFKYYISWQRIWLSVFIGDWQAALKYTKILKDKCNWSRAVFSYMYASMAHMVLRNNPKDENLYLSMMEAFENVPKLKRNLGGKKVFHEKLVIERSRYFLSNPQAILMPHLDLMYIWNQFKLGAQGKGYIEKIIDDINSTYEDLKESQSLEVDASCYLIFMKAVCYSVLNEHSFASDLFEQVIKSENQLKHEKHLVPQAYYELGMINRAQGNKDLARKYLKRANSYGGYLTQVMIQFRCEWVLSTLD